MVAQGVTQYRPPEAGKSEAVEKTSFTLIV